MTTKLKIPVLRTPSEMQNWARSKRSEAKTIGVVPTMGALHEGHFSLIERSTSENDETILTIFVNPLQFGAGEDFEKYPRNEGVDILAGKEHGATLAYCPTVVAMYPADSSVYVVEEKLASVLCGKSRPGHFRGVLTVVAKLFNACLPDKAYFGEKDYQQLLLIKRMVRDLNFPIEIVPCPIVREQDGLAKSSRNAYLTESERRDAICLKKALDFANEIFVRGERNPRILENEASKIIEKAESAKIDYVECRDAESLDEINVIEKPAVLALAVFIGSTRLIDNMVFIPSR